jgi:Fe-S cluster assembly protein SufB
MNLLKKITYPYKFGFSTILDKTYFPYGLNLSLIKLLSLKKKETELFFLFRINSYNTWIQLDFPLWNTLYSNEINFLTFIFYSIPKKNKYNYNNYLLKIQHFFKKLGIYSTKTVATDTIFDSISINIKYKNQLYKIGIIFNSISIGLLFFPNLLKKFLGKIIKINDNFFATLNSIIYSDGSFCYISKNIICPINISSYFRINDKKVGQFERTLIVCEKKSEINYIEGCTAKKFDKNQLHTAIVELIGFENSRIKYFTIQNWYSGNKKGIGGIYNIVTKRGICIGKNCSIQWTQFETGSLLTWKYPSCVLLGNFSNGEFFSISFTKDKQLADTGTKMWHIGKNTNSKILSKSISMNKSLNCYRGQVKIGQNAISSKNFSQCDSFILHNSCNIKTHPYIDIFNMMSTVEHEARISKITKEQLFFLQQRGFSIENATELILNSFCNDILLLLPIEFSLEIKNFLFLKLNSNIA